MNLSLALFVLLGFLAVVLLLEGLYVYWNDTKSPEVRRVEGRIEVRTGDGKTQVHRTERRDGGETADFY